MDSITDTQTGSSGNTAQARAGPIDERATIRAKSIMTTEVAVVGPDEPVRDVARLMAERHLGAVPVLEGDAVVGIVTDGDLLRREELGTDTVCAIDPAGDDCAKSHGRSARDVMTPDVVTIVEDTTLADISELMAIRRIKRVPVLRAGRLVGIVSRSDIVRALVARPEGSHGPLVCDDDIVRFQVFETLMGIPGASAWQTSVGVSKGVVRLDGVVDDETAREPSRLAVERLPCVVAVDDHRSILLPY